MAILGTGFLVHIYGCIGHLTGKGDIFDYCLHAGRKRPIGQVSQEHILTKVVFPKEGIFYGRTLCSKETELCTNYSGVLVIWLSHNNIMVATTGVVCCINLFSYMGDLLASNVHCCVMRPSLVTKPTPPASARASCNGPVNWNVMHWTLLQHPRYIFHQCQPESKLLYTREV